MKNEEMKKIEGFFAINKEKGPTSHDIVDRVRRATGVKKVGHAGTLDPMAKGVLVVAVGRKFTKRISEHRKAEKVYLATFELGKISDSWDAEGEVKAIEVKKEPLKKDIESALKKFEGEIDQRPPVYSAIKVNGVPSYKLARKGKKPKLKKRKVLIKKIEFLDYQFPFIKLRITTGSGVYIRSIARDLGAELNTGAILTDLVRERVGEFSLKDSISPEDLK